MKFKIFQDKRKEWRFRILSGNNKTIASSEGYTRRHGMFRTIRVLQSAFLFHVPVFEGKEEVEK